MKFIAKLHHPGTHGCFVDIPQNLVELLTEGGNKRVICTINGSYDHHCMLTIRKDLGPVVYISKRVQKEAGIIREDTVEIDIRKDDTKYQARMPEELKEVLDTDPEALQIFDELSPGKQRSILFSVDSAKRVDTRISRALKIVENLKLGERNPQKFLK